MLAFAFSSQHDLPWTYSSSSNLSTFGQFLDALRLLLPSFYSDFWNTATPLLYFAAAYLLLTLVTFVYCLYNAATILKSSTQNVLSRANEKKHLVSSVLSLSSSAMGPLAAGLPDLSLSAHQTPSYSRSFSPTHSPRNSAAIEFRSSATASSAIATAVSSSSSSSFLAAPCSASSSPRRSSTSSAVHQRHSSVGGGNAGSSSGGGSGSVLMGVAVGSDQWRHSCDAFVTRAWSTWLLGILSHLLLRILFLPFSIIFFSILACSPFQVDDPSGSGSDFCSSAEVLCIRLCAGVCEFLLLVLTLYFCLVHFEHDPHLSLFDPMPHPRFRLLTYFIYSILACFSACTVPLRASSSSSSLSGHVPLSSALSWSLLVVLFLGSGLLSSVYVYFIPWFKLVYVMARACAASLLWCASCVLLVSSSLLFSFLSCHSYFIPFVLSHFLFVFIDSVVLFCFSPCSLRLSFILLLCPLLPRIFFAS